MAKLLIPGEVLAITGQAADLLLRLDNGDAALLYLHLLRRGTVNDLNWPQPRLSAALSLLRGQGLAPKDVPDADPPAPEAPPPEYALEDLNAALNDKASSFPALCDEVERRLGKKLSANDLRVLYTLFDHLALPAEVILMLVGWCTEEMERKYGPGRKPFLSQIRREGFAWAPGHRHHGAGRGPHPAPDPAAQPGGRGAAPAGYPRPAFGGAGEDVHRRLG